MTAMTETRASSRETPHGSWLSVEAFRTLRTNLLMRMSEDSKLLLITSSRPKEGKSTVAANLACSVAALGKSVLLVDADLRRPRLHQFFGIDNHAGLSDVLSDGRSVDDVLGRVPEGPYLVTSGPTPPDPQALLTSERFDALVDDVRGRFDMVLVDSAPFLAVADTSLIVPRMDGVVFVLRSGLVTESEAIRTKIRLDAAGTPVVGAVLNAFEATDPDYYHPYSSYYTREGGS
jgi:capsular exopolysaccharide synthesis family protein